MWLFLRNFVAILAMKMNKIDYFWLSTVGNTVWGRTIHRRGGRTDHWCEKDWSLMWGDQLLMSGLPIGVRELPDDVGKQPVDVGQPTIDKDGPPPVDVGGLPVDVEIAYAH